jgi:hypothetical protein
VRELAKVGFPVVCMDARAAADAVKSRRVKSDKADAYALAEILRTGWYRTVYVKSQELGPQADEAARAEARGRFGQRLPLATSRQHVENAVQNLAHIDRALAAAMLGWWDYGLNNRSS